MSSIWPFGVSRVYRRVPMIFMLMVLCQRSFAVETVLFASQNQPLDIPQERMNAPLVPIAISPSPCVIQENWDQTPFPSSVITIKNRSLQTCDIVTTETRPFLIRPIDTSRIPLGEERRFRLYLAERLLEERDFRVKILFAVGVVDSVTLETAVKVMPARKSSEENLMFAKWAADILPFVANPSHAENKVSSKKALVLERDTIILQEESDCVYGTLSFRNGSDEEVTITRIQTSCKCAVANLSKSKLKPGEIGTVRVEIQQEGGKTGRTEGFIIIRDDKYEPGYLVWVRQDDRLGKSGEKEVD